MFPRIQKPPALAIPCALLVGCGERGSARPEGVRREVRVEPETIHFKREGEKRVPDPEYSIRSWRAVVTYPLRQQEFLYE